MLALSGLQFNLHDEVFAPMLKALLPVVDIEDALPARATPLEAPDLPWEQALELGRALMAARTAREGFTVQEERWLWLNRAHGFYAYAVQSSLDIHAQAGRTVVYLSPLDGQDVGFEHPSIASGNAVSRWLAALHMGRVGGLPYRIVLCVTGLIVAALSVTGVAIWWKKRQGRRHVAARQRLLPAQQEPRRAASDTRTARAVLQHRQTQDRP